MVLFPGVIEGMVRNMSIKKKSNEDGEKEAAREMAKEAKRNKSMICLSGSVKTSKFDDMAYVCTKRGNKGINQDSLVVWEDYGCQGDVVFCGIFDGHGPWGHMISKQVRKSLPLELLTNWQQNLSMEADQNLFPFNIWKQSCLKSYAAIDEELKQHPRIDSFYSGTTALTVVKQGRNLVVANAGDSRAVLAVTSDDGCLKPVQLSVDFKPNLPEEAERIKQSRGRVVCLKDEPGVYRVWTPNSGTPGLAISRAFGDYCTKQYGLISVPDVSHRTITSGDQFVIVATDGVWDVMSNQEAVHIVSSTSNREMSAKRLVDCASRAWKSKKRGIARDDMSAICLFFNASPTENDRDVNI